MAPFDDREASVADSKEIFELCMDIVDACNLACTTCARGIGFMKNNKSYMDMKTLHAIIDKAIAEGTTGVALFNWTEPFLHPHIVDFTRYLKKRQLKVRLSSNLSLPSLSDQTLIHTLKNCEELLVSVSGFTQKTYIKNHKGGNVETVKKHINTLAEAKYNKRIYTYIQVKYLDFGYNTPEADDFKRFTEERGLEFLLFQGVPFPQVHSGCTYEDIIRAQMTSTFDNVPKNIIKNVHRECGLIKTYLPLDYKGDAYLCCAFANAPFFKIANYMNTNLSDIQAIREKHPYCAFCNMERLPLKKGYEKFTYQHQTENLPSEKDDERLVHQTESLPLEKDDERLVHQTESLPSEKDDERLVHQTENLPSEKDYERLVHQTESLPSRKDDEKPACQTSSSPPILHPLIYHPSNKKELYYVFRM